KPAIALGDVVVAVRVYAYHGGRSAEDFRARPRVWEAPHAQEQAARHVDLAGDWLRSLSAGEPNPPPRVHFEPIAAGEVVLESSSSSVFQHLDLHYNDAVAIETEGAGIAHAAHLSSLPALVIRGISARADADADHVSDGPARQLLAAANAAAFAAALLG